VGGILYRSRSKRIIYLSGDGYTTQKYAPNGDLSWSNHYEGADAGLEHAWGMEVDNQGNVFVTGISERQLAADDEIATVKFNSDGVFQWARQELSVAYWQVVEDPTRRPSMDRDADGNIYVNYNHKDGKVYQRKYDTNGNSLWTTTPGKYDTYNNVRIFVNQSTKRLYYYSRFALQVISLDADPLWNIGLDIFYHFPQLISDQDNNIIAAGYFAHSIEVIFGGSKVSPVPTHTMLLGDIVAYEGNSDTGPVLGCVPLTLNHAIGFEMGYKFSTAPGTATSDLDFNAAPPDAISTIPIGTSGRDHCVYIKPDQMPELLPEKFYLKVVDPPNTFLPDKEAMITIVEDQIDHLDWSVVENLPKTEYWFKTGLYAASTATSTCKLSLLRRFRFL
jgi:hypothetical protein